MFITITHDDAVNVESVGLMSQIVDARRQPNGCPVPVTWFTAIEHDGNRTTCDFVRARWRRGDEIGLHTWTHPQSFITEHRTKTHLEMQILGARSHLMTECGLPKEHLVGYRSPFLITNPESRQVLYSAGFLYDSSIFYGQIMSQNTSLFPYTLHNGVPEAYCDEMYSPCVKGEKYPGMWEVMLYRLAYEGQLYTMDPGNNSPGNGEYRPVFDVLKANFDDLYAGPRTPLPIYVHLPWFTSERIEGTLQFVNYALSHPDVYFVTMRQLIEWMKDPVPATEMVLVMCLFVVPGSVYCSTEGCKSKPTVCFFDSL